MSSRLVQRSLIRLPSRWVVTLCVCALILLAPASKARSPHALGYKQELRSTSSSGQTYQADLAVDMPIEEEISGSEIHSYWVTLASGQYLHVIVDQRGTDLTLIAFDPDGQKLNEFDTRWNGMESASLVAEKPGRYRLEIRPLLKIINPTRYEVKITELRASMPQDQTWIAAERASTEGKRLLEQGTAESLQKAMARHQEALPLWQTAGDRVGESATLNTLGFVHHLLGENQTALELFRRALALRQAARDGYGQSETLHNIGGLYSLLGKKQWALNFYQQALEIKRAISDQLGEALTLNNIAAIYSSSGEYRRALDYFHQLPRIFKALGDRIKEIASLNNIGATYYWKGEPERALDYSQQALALSQSEKDGRGEAYARINLGRMYERSKNKQIALDHYAQALLLMQRVGDKRGEAASLINLGRVHHSLGQTDKAHDSLTQALRLSRRVGDPNHEASALLETALVKRDQGRLIEARTDIEAALAIVESMRSDVATHQLRTLYLATKQNYYEFYINLLMQLHQLYPSEGHDAAALQVSERARARSLLEILVEARVDIREGVDPGLAERERHLQQQISSKINRRIRLLSGRHTEEQATELNKELEKLHAEFQQIQGQIRTSSPRYAALTQPQPLNLTEIQRQVVDDDSVLLEYALGDERSYLWMVTPTSINSFQLPRRSVVEDAARKVYGLLTEHARQVTGETPSQREARLRKAALAYPTAAGALSQMLLGPVAHKLGAKRLLIVSDGALQYVPFGALPVPELGIRSRSSVGVKNIKNGLRFRASGPPLVVEHDIVSLPSASTLAVLRHELAGRQPAPKTVAVLADPVFEPTDLRVKRGVHSNEKSAPDETMPAQEAHLAQLELRTAASDSGIAGSGRPIARLPYSRQEGIAISALVPAPLLILDFEVNYRTASSPQLGQYRIVHFATHGLVDSERPELSGLLLSLVDEQGRPQENGILRLGDIYNLKLGADLVVLSACQTALGKEIKGEGLLGLTRGFIYAGASGVVASLWQVNDKATAQMMKLLYEGMLGEQRLRPAAALRRAQIEMWRKSEWRQPYYWAAFVLQGEWK